jgi:hypothetical protein
MGLMKELNDLNGIYHKMYDVDVDEAMVVTAADKKGNTPAYQGYKAGKKNVKTGKPLYKAADHLKDEVEVKFEPSETVKKLIESGRFSIDEVWKIVEVEEGYQRNPEEGERKEREANKKYEKVRGERTPMPPRGNKRREDFERWYAANVR